MSLKKYYILYVSYDFAVISKVTEGEFVGFNFFEYSGCDELFEKLDSLIKKKFLQYEFFYCSLCFPELAILSMKAYLEQKDFWNRFPNSHIFEYDENVVISKNRFSTEVIEKLENLPINLLNVIPIGVSNSEVTMASKSINDFLKFELTQNFRQRDREFKYKDVVDILNEPATAEEKFNLCISDSNRIKKLNNIATLSQNFLLKCFAISILVLFFMFITSNRVDGIKRDEDVETKALQTTKDSLSQKVKTLNQEYVSKSKKLQLKVRNIPKLEVLLSYPKSNVTLKEMHLEGRELIVNGRAFRKESIEEYMSYLKGSHITTVDLEDLARLDHASYSFKLRMTL